jgi:cytochrome c-type biogenesis protein CcmF
MYKMWNLVLIVITFMLTLLGTMMTRSGVVQSVHAFAQSDIGQYFFAFIIFAAVTSIGLLAYRANSLKPERGLESIMSREFAFLVNNWVLLAAAFFVTFATLFPSIFKFVTGREVNVGPAFFNLWMVPIGLCLLFLTGVGPLLSWRKSTAATLREQFAIPLVVGALTAVVLVLALGVTRWAPLVTITLCAFVTSTIVQEFVRGTRARRANTKETLFDAFITLVSKARRRYGGYIVHFGAVVMFFGFAGNSFKLESEQTVKKGGVARIGRYDVRLDDLVFEDDGQKNMVTARVTVLDAKTGAVLDHLSPAKWSYRKPEEQVTSEVSRLVSLREDLYLVLGGFDGENQIAALQLKVNPLVNFVWLGCSFLMIGFTITVWPEPTRTREPVRVRRLAAAFAGAATLLFGALSFVLAFL